MKKPSQLKYIFDLKGSLVDRKVKGATTATTTLKDVNFLMVAAKNKNFTKQMEANRILLKKTMRKDVEFLRSQGLMDYSLLLGIEVFKKRPKSLGHFHKMDFYTKSCAVDLEDLVESRLAASRDSNDSVGGSRNLTVVPKSAAARKAKSVDPGELMSRKHCFVNCPRVYHIAIIDYL